MSAAAAEAPGDTRDGYGRYGGLLRRLRDNPAASVAIAVAVVLAVWIATFHSILTERETRTTQARIKALELVGVLEAHVTNVLGYADTYLQAARREYGERGDLGDLQRFLDAVPPQTAILSHVTIIDASGKPVFISSGDPLRPGVRVTDRDYFRHLKSADDDHMFISRVARGRNSGLLTIRVARRLQTPDGAFDGVIFSSIRAEKLTEPFRSLEPDRDTVVGLVGLDGAVRIWSASGRVQTDVDAAGWPLWDALDTVPSGLFATARTKDGAERELAYARMQSYPLISLFSVARSPALSASSGLAWSAGSVALLITLVIVVMTASILRDARMMRALEREIAVRRRAEAEAVRATEVKSAFLATMSHEIRTPINAITGLFELIEKADVPDRQKRQARAGRAAAADLFKQLTNVLDASRLEAKSLELTLRREPLAPVMAELKQLLEAAIENSGKPIAFSARMAEDVPEAIRMDRRRVEQIILNFIDNAVKFTQTGHIDLVVDLDRSGAEPRLRLSVCDTGPGISEADRERIFAPFSQLDSAPTRRAGGAGLGLSICKQLADLMHADLTVGGRLGEGACFSLMLPTGSAINSIKG